MSAAQPATVWPVNSRTAFRLFIAALAIWAALPLAPNFDTATHLLWGGELLAGRAPDVADAAAPTLHPLWLLVATAGATVPSGASLMQLLTVGSFVVVIACAWRLAARIAGGVAGALAAVAVGSSFALMLLAFKAYVDLPFLALVLTALVVETTAEPEDARPGPLVVPALLLAAGLLRPEAWAFGLLFVAVRVLRTGRARAQVVPALVMLAAPVLWMLADLLLTGSPIHSLTGTQELAEELGRPTGLASAPKELIVLLGDLARPPVAAAGLLGIGFAVWLRGWRALLLPLAVLAAGAAGFLLVGALGLPLLQRYLLVPAVLVCVLAGVAGAVLVAWARGRRDPGGTLAAPAGSDDDAQPGPGADDASRSVETPALPSALRFGATAALVVGALGVVGYLAVKADSFRIVAQGVLREARWQDEGAELLDDPAVVRASKCGPITLPTYRFVPELTLRADRSVGSIVSRSTALGGAGPQPTGVAIVIAGNRAAKVRLGWAAGVPRETNDVPTGFSEIARRGPFVATARCG